MAKGIMKIKLERKETFYFNVADGYTPYLAISICIKGLEDIGLLPKTYVDSHPRYVELQIFRKNPKKKGVKKIDMTVQRNSIGDDICVANNDSRFQFTYGASPHIVKRLQLSKTSNNIIWVKLNTEPC